MAVEPCARCQPLLLRITPSCAEANGSFVAAGFILVIHPARNKRDHPSPCNRSPYPQPESATCQRRPTAVAVRHLRSRPAIARGPGLWPGSPFLQVRRDRPGRPAPSSATLPPGFPPAGRPSCPVARQRCRILHQRTGSSLRSCGCRPWPQHSDRDQQSEGEQDSGSAWSVRNGASW